MELTSYISFVSTGGTAVGYIPLDETVPLLLNLSLEDFKNPGDRMGSYSKPVKIPGSKEANILFGQIFAINSSDWTYNVNKKQSVIVYTNGVKTFKGYLKLNRINTKSETLNDAEQVNSYDCVIFDDRVNLYSELGSKQLTDFDFSQYDHVLNDYYTQETTGNTWQDAYVYPMMYGPSTVNYKTRDFLPSIFVRKYLEQMQIDNAFTFTGQILDDEQFVKQIIPYNGEVPKISEEDRLDRMFQASVSGDVLYSAVRVANSNNYTSDNLTTVDWYYPFNFPTHPSFSTFGRVINYNNESDAGNFDTGGNYDNSLYRFTSPAVGVYDFNVAFVGLFRWDTPTDGWLYEDSADPAMSAGTPVPFVVRLVKNKASITTKAQLEANTVGWVYDNTSVTMPQRSNIASAGPDVTAGSFYLKNFFFNQTFESITLGAGETLDVMFFTDNNRLLGATTYWDTSGHVGQATNNDNVDMTLSFLFASNIGAVNRFKNTPHIGNINNGDNIRLNDFIPRQVSQKDLFASIIKMNNLYIQENPENEREIYIKTREQFYSSTTYSDWSDVFCTELEWNQTLLSQLQTKRILFQYKEGKDPYNTAYKQSTGVNYGSKEVIFDSELLQGETKNEVIFESTPLQRNGFNLIVPAIDSAAPKTGPRILYYEGMREGNWVYQGDFNVNYSKGYYAYAGHFGGDNAPLNPTYDLNWSINDFYYFPLETTYTNSLYDRYWDDYIDFIANGKLLTGFFKLTEKHLNELDFGKKIWIEFFKSYFYVNKIIDFNASKPGITKVELFKLYEGNKNRPRGRRGDTIYKPQGELIAALDNQGGGTSGSQGGSSTILQDAKGDNTVNTDGGGAVLGTGIEVSSKSRDFIVSGNDHKVAGANSATILGGAGNEILYGPNGATIIGGVNNKIYGLNSGTTIIGGSNNYVDGTVSGVTIIGTSDLVLTASTDSGTYIEGIKFKDGFVSGMTIDGYLPLTGGILTGGLTGTSVNFAGPIMSAGTDLYSIFATSSSGNQTFVQPGLNTYTGGTASAPTVNISGATLTFLSATTISGGTLYSGSTNLSSIFAPISVSGGTSGSLFSGSTGSFSIIANNSSGNLASGNYSTVLGGITNQATGDGSIIIGGQFNYAAGQRSVIFGGQLNTATTLHATVVNGIQNSVSGISSFIGAGNLNRIIDSDESFIGAGESNTITTGDYGFIGVGDFHRVSALGAAVLNGRNNTATTIHSAVIGGNNNSVNGINSVIVGGSGFTSSSAANTVYVPNLDVRTNMAVTGTTNFASTVTAKGILNVSGATSLASTLIVGGASTFNAQINANDGIRFETSGGTQIWKFKSINLGGWNMDTVVSRSVGHGLSSTEFLTIRNVDVMIINDAQTNLYPLILGDEASNPSGYHNGISSTNISVGRVTGGGFDNTSFNDAGVNRGFISFWYIPD